MRELEIPRIGRIKASRVSFLTLTLLFAVTGWSQSANSGIRGVDFKNFTYPWLDPHGWPDHMQWISLKLKSSVQLVDGKWDRRSVSDKVEEAPFEGLTFDNVSYFRFPSGSEEGAIVVLRYESGGTQNHCWVYIYRIVNGAPALMGFFHAGDRAYAGLYRVYEKDQLLNVELFDPKLQEGDCCSSGYVNYQFRWNGSGFEATGKPRKGMIDPAARRPISVFGLPIGHK